MTDTFSAAMRLMRKHDPQLQEDGFGVLEPIAAEVLPQLIEAFEASPITAFGAGSSNSSDALDLSVRCRS